MKTFIHIALTATGHLYEVPTQLVADSRAAAMLAAHPDEFKTIEEAMADTVGLFNDDDYAIQDWAVNNMQVKDIMNAARLVRFTPPDLDIANGAEWTFHDAPAIIPQLDAQSVLQMPVEMAVSAMAVHRNVCQLVTLNDEAGQPCAAIALVQGSPALVGSYVGALTHLTNTFVQGPQAVNEAAASGDSTVVAGPTTAQ